MSRLALVTAGVLVVLVAAFPAAASAALPNGANGKSGGGHNHGGGSGGSSICVSTSTAPCGFDISYPQCNSSLPTTGAFAIVGVNDGLANDYNPCLSTEFSWALALPGSKSQPNVSLYVNTADPGNMYNNQPVADWPNTGGNTLEGSCKAANVTVRVRGHYITYHNVGMNSTGCAWQYGYNMVQGNPGSADYGDIVVYGDLVQVISPANYPWWLDVETANSWQSSTTTNGTAMNVAALQGMIAGFQAAKVATVGVYSTSSQWNTITGGFQSGSPVWIPGATNESGAQSNCSQTSFTGGPVTLTQWTGTFDSDYACTA